MFVMLLARILSASNHAKCMSLRNQKCITQPTLINLHLNEYSQELHYYPFVFNLIGCLEVAILLMTFLVKYMLQIKQKI